MRTLILVLGVLGGIIAGALGGKWLNDIGQLNELQRALGGDELQSMGIAGLLLLGACVTGIVGGIMAFRRKFVLARA